VEEITGRRSELLTWVGDLEELRKRLYRVAAASSRLLAARRRPRRWTRW
jgi:hypothetical protein